MDPMQLEELAGALVKHVYSDRLVPADLFAEVAKIVGAEDPGFAAAEWKGRSMLRAAQGKAVLDPAQPFILSRGFGRAMAEEELANYLPEEKILVNKDFFRTVLDGVDFSSISPAQERTLVERLQRESVGLRADDVVLYYNLIKVNKLASANKSAPRESAPQNPEQAAAELLTLAESAFGLSTDAFSRINGGKSFPDRGLVIRAIAEAVKRRKMNPVLLRNFLGRKTDKHVALLIDFLRRIAAQRGEDANELIMHTGIYLLLNNASADEVAALSLAAPLQAYVTDRIGKVRTVYYAAMQFILSFLLILLAQISEVSAKYADAAEDQRAKLRKLYEADDRRALLISNSVNVASRKLAEYKSETREIMGAFKSFLSAHKDMVQVGDLFGTDYRS